MTKHDRRYLHTWAAYKAIQKSPDFDGQLIEAVKRMEVNRVRCERCGKKLSVKIAVALNGYIYHSVCGMKVYEEHVRETMEKGELLRA